MFKQKILKIILIVVGLTIIIFSSIFVINSLNYLDNLKFAQVKNLVKNKDDIDTTNWKIYRNEEFGFEFKYPEEWEINTITRKKLDDENDILFNLNFTSQENNGRSLIIRDKKDGIIFLNRMEVSEPGEKTNIIINNIQWTLFDFTGGNVEGFYMNPSLSLATVHKNKTFILFTPDEKDSYLKKIAQTFQFLD